MPKNSWVVDKSERRDENGDRVVHEKWGDGSVNEHRYTEHGAFVNTVKTTSSGDVYVSEDLMNDDFEYAGDDDSD